MKKREMLEELTRAINGYRGAIIVCAANKTGLFAHLGNESKTAEELADDAGLDTRAVGITLNALAALKMVHKNGDRYSNTEMGKLFFLPESDDYRGDMINHNFNIIQSWLNLENILREGNSVVSGEKKRSGQKLRDFIMAMANVGKESIGLMLAQMDFSEFRHVIDIGGGPGTYLIELCRKYPDIKGTLFDLPDVITIARENVNNHSMGDRVSYIKGDFLQDDFGGGYDCVIISNIIHSLGEKDIKKLFAKSFGALEPGGMIIVKDFFLNEDLTSPQVGTVFAINMLVNTKEGRSYSWQETTEWLGKSGFSQFKRWELTTHSGVITARKQ